MPAPRIAIVGRPNVGKSSLLNLIAQRRVSIVDDTPGVTRDRVSAMASLAHPDERGPAKPVELTDTGGFGVYTAEGRRFNEVGEDLAALTEDVERQIAEAVSTADLILFAVDAQAGLTSQDWAIAKLLREQKLGDRARAGAGDRPGGLVPVRVVATKVDSSKWEPHAYELSALGFGEPLMCSSTTKYLRRDMLDRLYDGVGLWRPSEADPGAADDELRVAIVGKRNAGKSTLINRLAGEERVIVSEIAGTTRDAIDVRIGLPDGRTVTAIDTAGLRRKKSFQDRVEWYAFDRMERAVARADVVLLMIDAEAEVSQVDEQLAALLVKSFKPVVVVINKWDLAEGRRTVKGATVTPEDYEAYVRRELAGLSFAPLAFISAKDGTNVEGVIDLAFEMREQAAARVGTGELNRFFRGLVTRHAPPYVRGSNGKVLFASQVRTDPPTIVLIVNRTEPFGETYRRYVMNRVREELPFGEVPVRVIYRSRKRAEEAAIRSGRLDKRARGAERLHAIDPETQDVDEAAGLDELLKGLPDDASFYFDDEDEPGAAEPAAGTPAS